MMGSSGKFGSGKQPDSGKSAPIRAMCMAGFQGAVRFSSFRLASKLRNLQLRVPKRTPRKDAKSTPDTATLLAELRAEMRDLIAHGGDWEAFGLKVFRFQCAHNPVYGEFVRLRV